MLKIYEKSIKDIDYELIKAAAKHPGKFNSKHEGFAVLKEEVDELWDDIKGDKPEELIYKEAVQVAAMAIRIMQECCSKKGEY